MKIVLERIVKDKYYTIGKLYLENEYFCDTLEDAVREKIIIRGETAIPHGTYKIEFYQSKRFKCLMPYLLNVPDFEGIMIHNGNTVEDTKGCILVGKHNSGSSISHSKDTFEALYKALESAKRGNITIEIL